MTPLLYVLGILIAAFGIALSIALHEIGHLVPAKRFGLRVPQYMIGFGPTMWSRRFGETEYGVKAIPLGGYIRMIGMFPPRPGDDPLRMRVSSTGRMSQLVDEARKVSLEEMRPGDEDRVFYKLSVPKKVVIMLGGPTMNLLIAVVVFTGLFTLHGIVVNTPVLSSVSQCVDIAQNGQNAADECTSDMPLSPANEAGFKPGDRIVAVDGQRTTTWDQVTSAIRGSLGQPVDVVVDRGGKDITLHADPMVMDLPVYDDHGLPETDDQGNVVTQKAGFLGMSGTPAVQRQPLTAVPGLISDQVTTTAGLIVRIPEKMAGVARAAFGTGARDPQGPMSVVGVGRVAGEVASDQAFGTPYDKLITLLFLLGSLNVALFVFNLIPLLPLDGGHVAGALWEGVKRRGAKLMGRADPGPVDVAKALPLAYAVASVLIVMSALLMYADIVNPIRLTG